MAPSTLGTQSVHLAPGGGCPLALPGLTRPTTKAAATAGYHACGGVAFVHECPVGVHDAPYPAWTHEQILDLQLLFFDELFLYAVTHPVKWTP